MLVHVCVCMFTYFAIFSIYWFDTSPGLYCTRPLRNPWSKGAVAANDWCIITFTALNHGVRFLP